MSVEELIFNYKRCVRIKMLLLTGFCEANHNTGGHMLLSVKNHVHLRQLLQLVNYHFDYLFREKKCTK